MIQYRHSLSLNALVLYLLNILSCHEHLTASLLDQTFNKTKESHAKEICKFVTAYPAPKFGIICVDSEPDLNGSEFISVVHAPVSRSSITAFAETVC